MGKTKSAAPKRWEPLATGQIWSVTGLNLQVGMIGPMLVHYKLAKPDAVRIPNLVSGKSTIEKYLKKNKAVLITKAPAATVPAKKN